MVDMETTCRTCMKNNDKLIYLFGPIKLEDNYNMMLADVLAMVTPCQVMKNDGMPQNVCSDCVNILQILLTFRSNSLKSEETLKKMIFLERTLKEEIKDEEPASDESTNIESSYEETEIYPLNSLLPKIENIPENHSYECDKCKKHYTSHKRFLNHLSTHDETSFIKPVPEVKLEADFTDNIDNVLRETHISDTKIQADKYKCNECEQSFSKERSLIAHRRKHRNYIKKEDNLRYECDYCGKDFSMKPLLKRHLKLHSMNRPFVCTQCPKSYTRQDQLLEHSKRHDKIKSHVCSYCNKGFFQLCSLKDHLRVHTKEAPYLCSQCGKSFTNNSNLRQHMIRHSGVKPFACTFCPKMFSTKGQMMSHIVTHTGAHPHKCDECGASFTKPNSLKKHKFIHLDIKAFACETCGKRFTCKDHLKRHQRTHTGEKPYQCKYCDRAFTQSNDAVKHMRMHVGQNIYHCTVCNMKFRLMRDLKKHYPTHYIKGSKAPTVPVGNGMVAPIMVASEDADIVREDNISQSTEGGITITVNNGFRDGLAGGIIINVAPQNGVNV
ncbi:gastrula zinc finger protein XlCGF57.1-like isoform X1 [Battus philenor]|uniref:gastrula zinc finger protein XlCGF57.1-like isoform X1 n=1 Tax=Battus philenor TaxID=42288 RepID=UPI0035D137BF